MTYCKALINFCALGEILGQVPRKHSEMEFVCKRFSGDCSLGNLLERDKSSIRQRERLNSDAVAIGSHLIQWDL